MILERKSYMDFKQIAKDFRSERGVPEEPAIAELEQLNELFALAQAGANEIGTKLENLDSEFQVKHDHNPIHHIEERIKSVQSLMKKLDKKGLDRKVENIEDNISDIAGLRVVTNYLDDIYLVEKILVNQSDVTLLKRKDYVKNPKPSGYRSLHLVVSVPVFQASGSQDVKVEIQIWTVGMDMWASLEHKLRYKTDINQELVDQYGSNLQEYSDELEEIETKMQKIYQHLNEDSEIKRAWK